MFDPLDILLPFMFMFFAASIAFIVSRFLRHRERMAYVKQGMYPPDDLNQKINRNGPTPRMRRGIITTFVGSMLTFGLSSIGFGPWLLGGLIPLGIGIALMIIGRLEMGADDLPPQYDYGTDENERLGMIHEEHEPIPPHKIYQEAG